MKINKGKRIAAFVMAVLMVVCLMPTGWLAKTVASASDSEYIKTYTMEASTLDTFAANTKKDGDELKLGTNDFFTAIFSTKSKVDTSSKTFDDGYTTTNRINLGGKMTLEKNAIKFTTEGKATVKIWWVEGGDDNRQMAILNSAGTEVTKTSETLAKNACAISTLELSEAGTYYLGGDINNNYIFKVEVTVDTTPETVVNEYTMEASTLDTFAANTKKDGDELKLGTNDFFTAIFSTKSKVDTSSKTFDDGYTTTNRINFGGKMTLEKNAIKFTTEGTATVKIWWVEGGDDNRQIAILNSAGAEVTKTSETLAKNACAISTLELSEAGTYYLGGDINNNYIFKVVVTDTIGSKPEKPARADWAGVAAPVITSVTDDGKGAMTVNFDMLVGYDGADKVTVKMTDAAGVEETKNSSKEGTSGSVVFNPTATGKYTFTIVAIRENEQDKAGSASMEGNFVLPLGTTSISSATGNGKDAVALVWTSVKEADKYVVSYKAEGAADYTKVQETADTQLTVTGLKTGTKYTFKVEAVRNNPAATTEVTYDKNFTTEVERVWSSVAVGTQASSNKLSGIVVNEDGSVTMEAPAGKMASSNDGFLFYYTVVDADKENFKLSAKVTLNNFTGDNQSGVGLLVADTIGLKDQYDQCCELNYYLAGLSKTEWFDADGVKITYPQGPSFRKITGCTDPKGVNATGRVLDQAHPFIENLDLDTKTGGIVTKDTFAAGTCEKVYELTLVKDNNSYYATLKSADGVVIKFDNPDKLLQQDKDNVYVGFAVARNVKATFSDIVFESRSPEQDPPRDESTWEKDLTRKQLNVYAGGTTSQAEYNYRYFGTWDANVTLTDGDGNVLFSKDVKAEETISYDMTLTKATTKLITTITPNKETVVADSYDPVVIEKTVKMKKYGKEGQTIIVSPNGSSKGTGTESNPLDIYTAVAYAQPGQVILLKNGVYDMYKDLVIPYSVSGKAGKMIILKAETPGKVKLDGSNAENTSGSMVQVNGDYWHLFGLEICNSAKLKKGVQVSGNNNIVELCDIHDNGTTGLQISRSGGEPSVWWPKNNLIKNCDSYNNCDVAFNDADGFGAKLTVGEGNKFYGCMAYNNIDDGWDLYAKNEWNSGSISPVVIENCIAFNNGWLPGVEQTGEGNGFKLGGEGLPGAHKLINCVSFGNGAKGIASNNGPDCQVINCTSANNGQFYNKGTGKAAANINLSPLNGSKYNGKTNYVLKNTISFTTNDNAVADEFTLIGQDSLESENNFLLKASTVTRAAGLVSVNSAGVEANADWFVSTDTSKLPKRNANGTIDMGGLFVLTDVAKAAAPGVGATIVTTGEAISVAPSNTTVVTGDTANIVLPLIIALLSVAVFAGVILLGKKKSRA